MLEIEPVLTMCRTSALQSVESLTWPFFFKLPMSGYSYLVQIVNIHLPGCLNTLGEGVPITFNKRYLSSYMNIVS